MASEYTAFVDYRKIDPFKHEMEFKEKSLKFLKNSYVGPNIVIELVPPTTNNFFVGDFITINTIIKNLGGDSAVIDLMGIDGDLHSMVIGAGQSRIVADRVFASHAGNITINPVSANYSYARRTYNSISDSLVIESKASVTSTPVLEEEEVIDDVEVIPKEENITEDAKQGSDEGEDLLRPSFIKRFMNKIKSWFSLQ